MEPPKLNVETSHTLFILTHIYNPLRDSLYSSQWEWEQDVKIYGAKKAKEMRKEDLVFDAERYEDY